MELIKWMEFFDDLQNVRGRSKNTVMAYRRDLELFSEYRKKSKDINGFYQFMKDSSLSERSQARVISSLRTYFKFLEANNVSAPELRNLKPIKVRQKLPKVLTQDDFRRLFEASKIAHPYRSVRNQTTLLLLFGLGCRVTELIELDLENIDLVQGRITITGKGDKQRVVPITERLLNALDYYLKDIRPHLAKGSTRSMLINDRGKRPSRVDVWRWLNSWSKAAGFSETIGPHQFRHGCATALLESGADLRSIQMLLGHSSLQTTQIYTSVTNRKMKETIKEHHPLDIGS